MVLSLVFLWQNKSNSFNHRWWFLKCSIFNNHNSQYMFNYLSHSRVLRCKNLWNNLSNSHCITTKINHNHNINSCLYQVWHFRQWRLLIKDCHLKILQITTTDTHQIDGYSFASRNNNLHVLSLKCIPFYVLLWNRQFFCSFINFSTT